MNISQVKKLRKIVTIKKLATKNNKIFVCIMKKTSVHYRMVLTIIPCLFYSFAPFPIQRSYLCTSLFSGLSKAVHWWLPLKPPIWFRGEEGIHTKPTVQYWSVPEEDEGWTGTGLKLQRPSTSMKAQYSPSASAVFQMRSICLCTVYDANFERL